MKIGHPAIHLFWGTMVIVAFGLGGKRSSESSGSPKNAKRDAEARATGFPPAGSSSAEPSAGRRLSAILSRRGDNASPLSAEEMIEQAEELFTRIEEAQDPLSELATMSQHDQAMVVKGMLLDDMTDGSQVMSQLLLEKKFFGVADQTLAEFFSFAIAAERLDDNDPDIRQAVLDHLQLSPELQEIAQEETAQMVPVRNAQNVASVFASATAAGADLTGVTDTMTAIRTIRDGVYGGDSFSSTRFQVPNLSEEEIASAAAHLDFRDGRLVYR
jgi:hypothetical protein